MDLNSEIYLNFGVVVEFFVYTQYSQLIDLLVLYWYNYIHVLSVYRNQTDYKHRYYPKCICIN